MTERAFDSDSAAVPFDKFFAEHQAQSGAFFVICAGCGMVKRDVEYFGDIFS